MPTIDDYNGIPMEQQTETNYNYNVGGEVKKTVPFTKELREWLLMFKSRGIRFADTIDELRLFTKHENKQMFGVIENGSIYQYQLVTTPDDGENSIKPENVYSYNTGRWIKVLSFSNEIVNLWSQMQYVGVWGNNPVPISATDTTFYIDNANGIDNATIDGTMAHPFKTITYAINRFGATNHYWNGKLTLNLLADYTDTISILNYFNSNLVINAGTYNISEIEMYGNGIIQIMSNDGEIGTLKSMLNQKIIVIGETFNNPNSVISFQQDYNVTLDACFVRGIISIEDVKGTVALSGLTVYPTFYVELLRCKAHVTAIDGDIIAYYCFITRALSPYITGTHNVITDMQPLSKVVYVNYDFVADYPDGGIFKTVADAQTWITANGGTLSDSNTWTIKLPSGLITETLTKMAYIDFEFSAGAIVDELVSDVDFNSESDIKKAILKNATINTLTIPSGKCIYLQNCNVRSTEIEDDTCSLGVNGGVLFDIDLGNSNCYMYNAFIKGNVFANFNETEFVECVIRNTVTIGVGETLQIIDTSIDSIINNGTLKNYQRIYDSNVTASENAKGLTRYTETANSSKFEIVMKTGASTWEWVTIKENTW